MAAGLFKAVGLGSKAIWLGWLIFHSLFDVPFSTVDVLFERVRLGPRASRTRHPQPPQGQAT